MRTHWFVSIIFSYPFILVGLALIAASLFILLLAPNQWFDKMHLTRLAFVGILFGVGILLVVGQMSYLHINRYKPLAILSPASSQSSDD